MNWRYEIDISGVLLTAPDLDDNDPVPDDLRLALADELMKASPLHRFAPLMLEVESVSELNDLLDRIYDAADRSRVWCGL